MMIEEPGNPQTAADWRRRAEELEAELREARETLEAIQSGEVDAIVIGGAHGDSQVFTLRDADRPYRVLIEQMREGAVTLSRDGIILYANHAFSALVGSDPEHVVGAALRRFLGDGTGRNGTLERLLGAGGRGEFLLVTGDGRSVHVHVSISALTLHEPGGEAIRCAIVTDLTEEKLHAAALSQAQVQLTAETARREGEGFSRLILESATDFAIIATDQSKTVTTWNAGARNIFGWGADEIVGRPLPPIWTEEDRKAGVPEAEMTKAAQDGQAEDERWHLRRDGSRFWANGLMMPLLGGGGRRIGFLKILRDRTESRAAEAALRESEARLRFTLTAGRLGAWELDLATGELITSDICRENFGRDPRMPFSYDELKASVHPDDRARMVTAVDRSIAERTDYDIEYRVVLAGDAVRWVQIRGRSVVDAHDTPVRMIGVSLDTTDRRHAEDQLQRLNDTLESRVREEVAERSKAEDALRQAQKMEAVGQLTGGVAHDFNNLLTIIRSSVDFLRRRDLPEDRQRRYIDAISDTVGRASKLTGQLLAFARRQALKPEVFDVCDRLNTVADMLQTVLGSRITIRLNLPDSVDCHVEADASQFETAIVNMAVNARDAMDGEGSVEITVTQVSRHRRDGLRDVVAVTITDSGSGIPKDRIAQIFEPFFTTKEVGKGTGLGLSQAYGFAKQSGGDLTVESEVGIGTSFTLSLPRVPPPAPSFHRSDEHKPAPQSGDGRRVLVVEDNIDVGTFSTQLLEDLGYRTIWAANALEALDLLKQDAASFDVVFSDIVMPGMDGVEMALEIRRSFPSLPVVLTSGYSDVLAQEGRHGFELLKKPYAVEELSHILRRATRRLS